jgi:hypothetical protein
VKRLIRVNLFAEGEEEIKKPWVDVMNLVVARVAQDVIDLTQRFGDVIAFGPVDRLEPFAGVRAVKRQGFFCDGKFLTGGEPGARQETRDRGHGTELDESSPGEPPRVTAFGLMAALQRLLSFSWRIPSSIPRVILDNAVLFADYSLCQLTVNHRFKIEGLYPFLEPCLDIGFFFIHVAMDFQKNLLADFGDQEPAIGEHDGSAERHVDKKFGDIVGVRAYATVGLEVINACRRNRAMDAVAGDAEP